MMFPYVAAPPRHFRRCNSIQPTTVEGCQVLAEHPLVFAPSPAVDAGMECPPSLE